MYAKYTTLVSSNTKWWAMVFKYRSNQLALGKIRHQYFNAAHRTGEWQNEQQPIKIKKQGRPAVSLFRYGLDFLCDAIVRLAYKTNHVQQALKILKSMKQ